MLTDPVADMLTRIRNATHARKATVDVPWSRHKEAIAKVLVEEGYLDGSGGVADAEAGPRRVLRITLRYDDRRRPVISGVKRVSRPSLRVYVGAGEIPAIRRGLGINVLSTPKGVLVDREARRQGVGGELVCTVW
jgi:small subunit ribosomal protein S8